MNSDFRELLQCFAKHRVRYLVVGGYAVIHYAQPDLRAAKVHANRPQDLVDLEELDRIP